MSAQDMHNSHPWKFQAVLPGSNALAESSFVFKSKRTEMTLCSQFRGSVCVHTHLSLHCCTHLAVTDHLCFVCLRDRI